MWNKRKRCYISLLMIVILLFLNGCEGVAEHLAEQFGQPEEYEFAEEIPEYNGQPFTIINNNQPVFSENEITDRAYEEYSELDLLGRCGPAEASIGVELMPEEERGPIGQIKPSGWHTVKYSFVDGNYLYNRCHLIGFQLTGENANEQNLITGTRYLNTEEMLMFENMVADFVRETNFHVMYRVTPVFEGTDLVAKGVAIEAYSVEDEGEGISFHVFCHNVQPGVEIDYSTGESKESEIEGLSDVPTGVSEEYVLNVRSHKYHLPTCDSVDDMAEHNKKYYTGTASELEQIGYKACQNCHPR